MTATDNLEQKRNRLIHEVHENQKFTKEITIRECMLMVLWK